MTTKALPQDPGNLTHRRPSSLHVRVRVHMPEPAATSDRLIMRRPTGHGPRDQGEGIGEGAERGLGPLCRIRQNGESGDWSGELADEAEGMLHIRSRGGEIEIYYALLETEDGA